MALATAVPHQGSLGSWNTAISAGGIATADAATINDPNTQIRSDRNVIDMSALGDEFDYVMVSMLYDPTLTGITDPNIVLFGASCDGVGNVGEYAPINNRNNARSVSLACAPASDAKTAAGTLARTAVDLQAHVFPRQGNTRFFVGAELALAGSTGSTATALVQLKFCKAEDVE